MNTKIIMVAVVLVLIGGAVWYQVKNESEGQPGANQGQSYSNIETRKFVGSASMPESGGLGRLVLAGRYLEPGEVAPLIPGNDMIQIVLDGNTRIKKTINTQEGEPFSGKLTMTEQEISLNDLMREIGSGVLPLVAEISKTANSDGVHSTASIDYSVLTERP